MTSPTQPKPTPIPAVLVYGTPTGPDLTQASWFRAEDKQAAKAAAVGLNFSVIDIQTDREKALIVGIHEGVLKGSGRMIVGSVAAEVYRRIEDYARKAAGTEAAAAKPASASPGSKPPSAANPVAALNTIAAPPNPWETLRVGAQVLTAYWNEKREFEGFWLATVKRIDKGEFTLKWSDAPEYPPFKNRRKNIAILHPDFTVSGK
jgi:hypothetical protein